MIKPVYLPVRDRLLMRHAARLLEVQAAALFKSHQIDGVIIERAIAIELQDFKATAAGLRAIARTHSIRRKLQA